MKKTLVTIGISHYRSIETVTKTIDSALKQTWQNIEIIIVDDFSNDGSLEKLYEVTENQKKIRIIPLSKNKGVASVRNEIIKNSNGQFLAFFDDDDISSSRRIEKQLLAIIDYERNQPKRVSVICHAARIQKYPNGSQRVEAAMGSNYKISDKKIAPNGVKLALRILTGKPLQNAFGSAATCSQMARLSTYKDLGGFDEQFRRSEDTEFNIRAALKGAHFIGIDEPLVFQQMTLTSEKKLNIEKYYSRKILQKYSALIEQHSNQIFCFRWLDLKFLFLNRKKLLFVHHFFLLFIFWPRMTAKRLVWALPNLSFNIRFMKFYNEKK